MYLLDTSAIIEILHDTQAGKKIREVVRGKNHFISCVTVYELSKHKKKNEKLEYLINNMASLNLTKEGSKEAGEIYKAIPEKDEINEMDILIAGVSIGNQLTVISLDKDFKRMSEYYKKVKALVIKF